MIPQRPPMPPRRVSRLDGAHAGQDLRPGTPIRDLVDTLDEDGDPYLTDGVTRLVGEHIAKGERLTVGDDGRVYAARPLLAPPR